MRTALAIGLAALLLPSAAARSASTPRIASIEAKLLYETTGRLSKNILPPADFAGWNVLIGEGGAEEPANDLLVSVGLKVDGDEANSSVPLKIVVTGNGKRLAERTFKSNFFKRGRVYRSLLVPDAACAGKLRVEASFGAQKKTAEVALRCGE